MITCMNCEHGHHCPHTGKADDLFHALLFVWDDMPKGKGSFRNFSRRFKKKDASAFREMAEIVRELYDIEIDFEFAYDEYCGPPIGILKCEKFKELDIRKLSKPGTKQTPKSGRQQTLFD